MPDIIDHVSYLSEEIGPRPGGTEEEQQAALYIADYLQKEAGLAAEIEDFAIASNTETPSLMQASCSLQWFWVLQFPLLGFSHSSLLW